MHNVGFFIYPGHRILDLAGPLGAFEAVTAVEGRPLYDVSVLSVAGGVVTGSNGVPIGTTPYRDATLDTVVFVGGMIAPMVTPEAIVAAEHLAGRTRRIASVCTGAFLLAAAGLLDGRRATTHWRVARELQQRHPAVRVEPDRIFISDGPIWSSAGITAGIDLALALIEVDHGAELARAVARELVVHHRRSGGQSQFSAMSQMEPQSDRIRIALNFARDHLAESLPVERLANAANLSVRQFVRAFRQETGETPARAVERLRVEAARMRLQDGAEPVEQIARAVGFNDPERMRRAFVKLHGLPPQAIRRASRQDAAGPLALIP
ncbi:GlxA family transcriptional regulator [Plastoroseomonas hellenica]|uniref:GlxA family transcriptional regulator n=1 Tax=Plastoroseomonas hellenica TaxID=2687306 RepID=UPI001BA72C96|nr:helix-turn-helix domain-containing protein [Plastoroseomonas hellenica]MBR0642711.1 helix-turn-helix domain-containing protein [Plastoroseomonas hellenica]